MKNIHRVIIWHLLCKKTFEVSCYTIMFLSRQFHSFFAGNCSWYCHFTWQYYLIWVVFQNYSSWINKSVKESAGDRKESFLYSIHARKGTTKALYFNGSLACYVKEVERKRHHFSSLLSIDRLVKRVWLGVTPETVESDAASLLNKETGQRSCKFSAEASKYGSFVGQAIY